jgi:hypothetical protein
MEIKTLEIRDRATFIPCLAISTKSSDAEQHYLLRKAGYSDCGNGDCILFGWLQGGKLTYDAYSWGDRTMATAHHHIKEHFDSLKNGDVIDVEFILGETTNCKLSQKFEGI